MKHKIVIIQVFDRCSICYGRIIPVLAPRSSHRTSILLFSFDFKEWVRKYSLCRELKGSHDCVVSCFESTLLGRRRGTKYSCILGRYRVHCSGMMAPNLGSWQLGPLHEISYRPSCPGDIVRYSAILTRCSHSCCDYFFD